MEKKVKETWDREKRERETLRQEIKKEWRKGEKRKRGEKQKEMNQKNEREKWTQKTAMKETGGNMLKDENETKKGRNKNKKWRFFLGWFFLWFKVKGEKDLKKTKIEENLTVFFFFARNVF